MPTGKMVDRRVARTKKALLDALHSLISEKDYDSIVVKEILDRADVGRSAFYTHFSDKDDLLAHGIQDIVGGLPAWHSQPGTHSLARGGMTNHCGSVRRSSSTSIASVERRCISWAQEELPSCITV